MHKSCLKPMLFSAKSRSLEYTSPRCYSLQLYNVWLGCHGIVVYDVFMRSIATYAYHGSDSGANSWIYPTGAVAMLIHSLIANCGIVDWIWNDFNVSNSNSKDIELIYRPIYTQGYIMINLRTNALTLQLTNVNLCNYINYIGIF